jgi:hypothetical protein
MSSLEIEATATTSGVEQTKKGDIPLVNAEEGNTAADGKEAPPRSNAPPQPAEGVHTEGKPGRASGVTEDKKEEVVVKAEKFAVAEDETESEALALWVLSDTLLGRRPQNPRAALLPLLLLLKRVRVHISLLRSLVLVLVLSIAAYTNCRFVSCVRFSSHSFTRSLTRSASHAVSQPVCHSLSHSVTPSLTPSDTPTLSLHAPSHVSLLPLCRAA